MDAAVVADAVTADAATIDSGGVVFVDAMSSVDADACGTGAFCNPVSQTGCLPAKRCALVLCDASSGESNFDCADVGVVPEGGACVSPTAVGASDDCGKGFHCYLGTCRAFCTTLNPTCASGTCVEIDSPIPSVGVCIP